MIAFKVQSFCLTNGNLRATAMADQFLAVIDRISMSGREPDPYLYTASNAGLRRVDLESSARSRSTSAPLRPSSNASAQRAHRPSTQLDRLPVPVPEGAEWIDAGRRR